MAAGSRSSTRIAARSEPSELQPTTLCSCAMQTAGRDRVICFALLRFGQRVGVVGVVLAAVLTTSPVWAEPSVSEAKLHADKGLQAYTLGRFADAITEFEKA